MGKVSGDEALGRYLQVRHCDWPSIGEESLTVLRLVHELDYSASELEDDLPNTQPTDGSDWTAEEKAKFRSDIFHCGINQSAISKAMNKCINSLMTCYSNLFVAFFSIGTGHCQFVGRFDLCESGGSESTGGALCRGDYGGFVGRPTGTAVQLGASGIYLAALD